MGIDFTFYQTSNRVPGVYVEMDPSQANTGVALQRSLLIGQMATGGTAPVGKPIIIESLADAQTLFGRGSMLAQMAARYMQRDPFGTLYCLPLADAGAAVAATGTITVTGTATAAGTLSLYIAGQRLQVPIPNAASPTVAAAAIVSAIMAAVDLGLTAANVAGVVTITSIAKGAIFNDIDIRTNYRGVAGGEATPPGLSFALVPMAGGTTNPDIGPALANLSSEPFDFICEPYTDTANLDAMKSFLADDVGRWSWQQMIYGGAFAAYRGTLGQCTSFGLTRNDQHFSIVAFQGSPDAVWIWATEICAASAASLRVDPGLPLQYINTTLLAPPIDKRWTLGERNTLLYDGMSTTKVGDDGTVIIERMCTTYQKNAAGAPDNSYLDVETLYGLMFVARDLSAYLLTRYARKKLVSDTTPILAGQNTVSAAMIRSSVIFEYRALQAAGYVQNADAFAKSIIAENAGNGLVKLLCPVDLVNQLRQIAILLQFRKS